VLVQDCLAYSWAVRIRNWRAQLLLIRWKQTHQDNELVQENGKELLWS